MKVFNRTVQFLLAVLTLSSCSSEDNEFIVPEETGAISLNVSTGANFKVLGSRVLNEEDYKNVNNYKVVISDNNGPVKEYASVTEVPASIELKNGSYTVTASYGKEYAKSRDEFYSVGSEVVTVQGEPKQVSLVCQPTCGKVKVNFHQDMATYFDDYNVEYTTEALGTADHALWAKNDVDPWYLLINPKGEEVKATITLTPKSQYATSAAKVVKTHVLKPNFGWTLNVSPRYSSSDGTLGITITIDETTNDIEQEIIVPSEWIK